MSASKSTGDTLEALVRNSLKLLVREGLAVEQVGVRVAIKKMGPRGRVKGRALGKASLDFSGDYLGRRVTFDTKSTKQRTRFELKLIKKHQQVICKNAHARGAIAFFLVEFSTRAEGPRYWCLTWPVLQPWWSDYEHNGAPASIPFSEIAGRCLEVKRVGNVLDLVGAVRALLQDSEEPANA